MVIQRWQSVFLLLAFVLMTSFCFVPFASQGVGENFAQFYPTQAPVYLTLNVLIALLSLLSIFMYKNIARQKTVVLVSFLLMLVSAVSGAVIVFATLDNAVIDWTGGILLLLASMLMSLAAYRRIVADEKLLKSYDRLR